MFACTNTQGSCFYWNDVEFEHHLDLGRKNREKLTPVHHLDLDGNEAATVTTGLQVRTIMREVVA